MLPARQLAFNSVSSRTCTSARGPDVRRTGCFQGSVMMFVEMLNLKLSEANALTTKLHNWFSVQVTFPIEFSTAGWYLRYIYWLVVWLPFFTFLYIGNNHPNWLSYFSEGWPNHQPVYDICDTTSYDWFRIAGSKYATSKTGQTGPWGILWTIRFSEVCWIIWTCQGSRSITDYGTNSGAITLWWHVHCLSFRRHLHWESHRHDGWNDRNSAPAWSFNVCTMYRYQAIRVKKNGPCKTASRPWACCESAWVVALDIPKLSEVYHVWAQHSCAAHPCHVPHTWPSCITIRTADLRAAQYFDWMAMYGAAVRCCDCRCWR